MICAVNTSVVKMDEVWQYRNFAVYGKLNGYSHTPLTIGYNYSNASNNVTKGTLFHAKFFHNIKFILVLHLLL